MFKGKKEIEAILIALSEQLESVGVEIIEMIVCGGTALNILDYVERTTKDVDVIAFIERDRYGSPMLVKADPLKQALVTAAKKVQKDFNLSEDWINTGPASVMDFGLVAGLLERTVTRSYSKNLIIHFLNRFDQIHFKLYAAVDHFGGKHYDDLIALQPSEQEIEDAARWSMTHDPSEGYRIILKDFLIKIGYKEVSNKF